MPTKKEFDICVFGATGVTGKYVIKELHKTLGADKSVKWAVAGRNVEKMKAILKECGEEFKDVPMIVADITNELSIADMCKRSQVILNTVGPYRFFGEQVVKCCVQHGSHHFDVSGEPQFLERMQLKYHDGAKEAGVYIVGACGMDSVPCDMGIEFVKQKFQGDLNSVETYISCKFGPNGYNVNLGTWQSAIHGLAHFGELKSLRKELTGKIYPKGLPKLSPKLKSRGLMFKSNDVNSWCFPFLGSDKSISIRSQMSNYDLYNERPTQVQTYLKMPSLLYSIILAFMASVFGVLTKFQYGQYLLTTYPGFFSLGLFKEGGPTEEQMKDARYKIEIFADGWSEKLAGPTDEHTDKPNKKMVAKVTGPDPGYLLTSIGLVQAGLTVLRESDKMPSTGGVFTTATAFKNTHYIDNLHKSGIEFHVVKE